MINMYIQSDKHLQIELKEFTEKEINNFFNKFVVELKKQKKDIERINIVGTGRSYFINIYSLSPFCKKEIQDINNLALRFDLWEDLIKNK